MWTQASSIAWRALRWSFFAALAVVLILIARDRSVPRDPAMERIHATLNELPYRPVAGRLTGERQYRPFQRRFTPGPTYRLRAATGMAGSVTQKSSVRGIALLLEGRAADAAEALTTAAVGGGTADIWSDLAAAYLAAAEADQSSEAALDALAAAARALEIDSRHAPAHFNRMQTLDWLGLRTESAVEARLTKHPVGRMKRNDYPRFRNR